MADQAFTEITNGLQFPEGPVSMPDGSVILTEMFASRLTRVASDGTKTTVAEINGSPNGLALGPDGDLYLCNNGNAFTKVDMGGLLYPGPFDPSRYIGGRIQRVNIATGVVTDLYTHCGEHQLRAPNDIVFDKHGGFYFTDHGTRDERTADRTGIYYATTDGSSITEIAFPTDGPNGLVYLQAKTRCTGQRLTRVASINARLLRQACWHRQMAHQLFCADCPDINCWIR